MLPFSLNGQKKSNFEAGISYGYRLNSGNAFAGYRIAAINSVLNVDLNLDKYLSYGYGIHLDYYPLKKTIISPFIGVGVSRSIGREYNFDREESETTFFDISPTNYTTPSLGVRYNNVMVDIRKSTTMALFIN